MGIISKTVKIIPRGTAIKYYREKGYDAKHGVELEVKVEDLSRCSTALVDTICDYCREPKEPQKYVNYNAQTKNGTEKCCCVNCIPLKRAEVMVEKYGHEYAFQVPEIKKRIQETNMERYGSVSPSGNAEVREKQKKTLMEHYGVDNPSKSEEIQDKIKKTCIEKFGVENPLLNEEVKEKIRQTILDRYGVENVSQNKDVQDKRTQTFIEHFGVPNPLQNEECLEKLKQTNLSKYGKEFSIQSEEVKQKAKLTNLRKYGYENPMKSPEFLEKWFAEHGSNFARTSRQQRYLCNLYNGILNQPFRCFALDIYLPEDKLDIEFDGSGHRMSISVGSISEENFEKKELYRNVALKKEGYKRMRIISSHDLLPQDTILLQMLSDARNYFQTTQHTWQIYDIDKSLLFNAEHKDGISYDFGTLRRIKDEDLTKFETEQQNKQQNKTNKSERGVKPNENDL